MISIISTANSSKKTGMSSGLKEHVQYPFSEDVESTFFSGIVVRNMQCLATRKALREKDRFRIDGDDGLQEIGARTIQTGSNYNIGRTL